MPTRTARFARNHPVTVIFLTLLVVIGVPVVVVLAGQARTDRRLERSDQRIIDYQVDNRVKQCESSNGGRKALQTVLDAAAHPPPTGSSSVDFSAIDGWEQLPESTQFFLTNLQTQLARPGGSAYLSKIAADYRRDYPSNLDCAAVGRAQRRKLEGTHA